MPDAASNALSPADAATAQKRTPDSMPATVAAPRRRPCLMVWRRSVAVAGPGAIASSSAAPAKANTWASKVGTGSMVPRQPAATLGLLAAPAGGPGDWRRMRDLNPRGVAPYT